MAEYVLTGDILHPGRISVEADSIEEALHKAEEGEFEVYDEINKHLAFEFCGDTDGGVDVIQDFKPYV